MDTWEAAKQLEPLIVQRAADTGFNLLSALAEKHGSWEMDFGRKDGSLNRYVCVAFTEGVETLTRRKNSFDVEFWAGADNGSRFTRRLTSKLGAAEEKITTPKFQAQITKALEEALSSANRIALGDLHEAFSLLPAGAAKVMRA